MKKTFIILSLISCFYIANTAFSVEVKSSDYEIEVSGTNESINKNTNTKVKKARIEKQSQVVDTSENTDIIVPDTNKKVVKQTATKIKKAKIEKQSQVEIPDLNTVDNTEVIVPEITKKATQDENSKVKKATIEKQSQIQAQSVNTYDNLEIIVPDITEKANTQVKKAKIEKQSNVEVSSDNNNQEIIVPTIMKQTNNVKDNVLISENDNSLIIQQNEKFGILDKKTNNYILNPVADKIIPFCESKTEFKFNVGDYIGYANTESGISFLTPYTDIFIMEKYLKVKQDGKFGLIDKEGNIILLPQYQQIGIIKSQDTEYITGKYNGKYKVFYNTGNLISESDLYTVSKEDIIGIERPIVPEYKKYTSSNTIVYEKINKADSTDNLVYEVEEIVVPGKLINTSLDKNSISESQIKNNSVFNVENKQFMLTKSNEKYGIKSQNNEEILPAVFDSINVKKPCKHFSKSVFVTQRGDAKAIYNIKGVILAEEVYGKVNVYDNNNVYSYTKENEKWILKDSNNKIIGELVQNTNGYRFTKTSFTFFNPHKCNELLIAILSI